MEDRNRLFTRIVFWIGVISGILGIIGFLIADLPALFGGNNESLADLQATLNAAQAELTQIALEDQAAANQATQEALAATQAALATQEAGAVEGLGNLEATRNAEIALTNTQQAVEAAAATQAAAATATANAAANITPTPTLTPTLTPTPVPVTDYRDIVDAGISVIEGDLAFTVQTAAPIPSAPAVIYVWSLDLDATAETGYMVQSVGAEARLTLRYDTDLDAWIAEGATVAEDGTANVRFEAFKVQDEENTITVRVDAEDISQFLQGGFAWVVRAEESGQAFSFFPEQGFGVFSP
ncbi:MAG: hypothetical protein GYB64_12420 [Chloroflexi bacterium]|nr:hypothetical protein [Chloroflexota bacterium]